MKHESPEDRIITEADVEHGSMILEEDQTNEGPL